MSLPIGIDLGTTNTVVAFVIDGNAVTLMDDNDQPLIPSVVSFDSDGNVVVGELARGQRAEDPSNTIYSVKRLIGRPWNSPEVQEARLRLPFELRQGPKDSTMVYARKNKYALPEVSAFILRRAKRVAEEALGDMVTDAVITVPANFNELQRASTKVAGRLAGLNVLRMLNEPTAAALAYGQETKTAECAAVFDLGGGTFDITVLDLSGPVFEVRATGGDTALGGDDIDSRIADYLSDEINAQYNYNCQSDPLAFARLRLVAEEMKIALSETDEVERDVLHMSPNAPESVSVRLTRAVLNRIAGPLIERTMLVTSDVLASVQMQANNIDMVILVGGSTRMPMVHEAVGNLFGRAPTCRLNPDEVVALGAAIQASALSKTDAKPNVVLRPTDQLPNRGRPGTLQPSRTGTQQPARAGTQQPGRSGTQQPGRTGTQQPGRTGTQPFAVSAQRPNTEPFGRTRSNDPAGTGSVPAYLRPPNPRSQVNPRQDIDSASVHSATSAGEPRAEHASNVRAPSNVVTTNTITRSAMPAVAIGVVNEEKNALPFAPVVSQQRTGGGPAVPTLGRRVDPRRDDDEEGSPEEVIVFGGEKRQEKTTAGIGIEELRAAETELEEKANSLRALGLPIVTPKTANKAVQSGKTMSLGPRLSGQATPASSSAPNKVVAKPPTSPSVGKATPPQSNATGRLNPIPDAERTAFTQPKALGNAAISAAVEAVGVAPRGYEKEAGKKPSGADALPSVEPPRVVGRSLGNADATLELPAIDLNALAFAETQETHGQLTSTLALAEAQAPHEQNRRRLDLAGPSLGLPAADLLAPNPAPLTVADLEFPHDDRPIEDDDGMLTGITRTIDFSMKGRSSLPPRRSSFPAPVDAGAVRKASSEFAAPSPAAIRAATERSNAINFDLNFGNVEEALPPGARIVKTRQDSTVATRREAALLLDVTPLSLRVETVGGYSDVIIAANSTVPCEKKRVFLTAADNQTSVLVRVAQGESSTFAQNVTLGQLELTGIKAGPRGEAKISVAFELDADGILNVQAQDLATGHAAQATMRLTGGNQDASDLEQMKRRQEASLVLG
jgi:molecular chaperone DnaK (HSP70)